MKLEIENVIKILPADFIEFFLFYSLKYMPSQNVSYVLYIHSNEIHNVEVRPAGTTLHQRDVPDSAFLTTYHNLHIQHLKRSS